MEKPPQRQLLMHSKLSSEFDKTIIIGNNKYTIQTEDLKTTHEVITRIYHGGEIISTIITGYSALFTEPGSEKKLHSLMQRQHKNAIESLSKEIGKSPADFLNEAKLLLRRKGNKSALHILSDGLISYPDDPFLMSYHGCLTAIVEKSYKEGVNICKEAIKRLNASLPFGAEFFYPVFYLNLGRAYLAWGRKKEAVESFRKGLEIDKENPDILWEMKKLGIRRKPPIPFLKRSNPLNKYIGLLISRISK